MNILAMPKKEDDYIHGYSTKEQDRLYAQARFLENMVFDGVDFSGRGRILEVGCGVGAQTRMLLDRFPGITVQAVDVSEPQIERARVYLQDDIVRGRVLIELADAERLPFPESSFDGAFICWVLEHVPQPLSVLRDVDRVLARGGIVHGIEVMNASFYLHSACPAVMAYWEAMNRQQEAAGGDPCVGAKLGNYLLEAGFDEIKTSVWTHHYDQRDRDALIRQINYWESLLLSAAPQLLDANLVDAGLIQEMSQEFARLRTDPRSVFHYTPIKFRAVASQHRR